MQPGAQFGRYRIERLLGEGGMGSVFLAHDTALERLVALKIPKFESSDSDAKARFLREARSAAALRHSNICPIYDVGEIDGTQYLTMSFIEGRSLADRIGSERRLTCRQIALLVRKLASALAEAHAAGIIHRDLKPGNIMLDRKGEPVVMDFGLARTFHGRNEGRITQSGMLIGSPAYMSPEQVQGAIELGPASDIYSLGVIFYELLTGRLPFDGTLYAILSAIVNQAPASPRNSRPDLDDDLQAICLRMLAKRAEERFASMNDVADALKDYLTDASRSQSSGLGHNSSRAPAAVQGSARTAPPTERSEPEHRQQVLETLPDLSAPGSRSREASSRTWRTLADRFRSGDRRSKALAVAGGGILLVALGVAFWSLHSPTTVPSDSLTKPGTRSGLKSSDPQSAVTEGQDDAVVISDSERSPSKSPPPLSAPSPIKAPLDNAQAKAEQDAWARHLSIRVTNTNSVDMKLVLIPPGEFTMGRLPDEATRFPPNGVYQEPSATQHHVTLTKPFLMGATEVTQRQWREVVGTEPWKGQKRGEIGDDYPATYTTKANAAEFCRLLSEKEGLTYRLPTEAEWEFACRAGTQTIFFFGNDPARLRDYASSGILQTGGLQRVATRKPNPWGLFDMYGNLWEWVIDGPRAFASDAVSDPSVSSDDQLSVVRGACFRSLFLREFSSGARNRWPGSFASDEKGFRVVCEMNDTLRQRWPASPAD